jgi:hypothetical protein
MWPICCILAAIFSVPLLLAAFALIIFLALRTELLWLTYAALFFSVIGGAAAWYGVRCLAFRADVARAQRAGAIQYSPLTLEEFIR